MIRSIIIDDEEDARVSLKLLLDKFCPQVDLVEICPDPYAGLTAINTHAPDLVFLDLQMPHMSGFDLLAKVASPRFQTIFVTAHDKYAIKAIRFSALDYLMKPVDVDELVSAVARATSSSGETSSSNGYDDVLHNIRHRLGQDGKLAIPTSEGMAFISLGDIIHIKADGSYTRLYVLDKKPILVSKKLKEFENILDPNTYCRIHHSSMINIDHVERYVKGEGGYVIMSNGQQVDISRRKKDEFMKLIAKM